MNASLPEIVSEPAALVFWKTSFMSLRPFSRLRRNCSSSCLMVVWMRLTLSVSSG